ncbi:hypothetical protein JW756_00710 [Candidatus Woesearchaeota archaeon]|nr:hypothetical protein [Candidatus Woesearchaeota archaeon]
MKRGAKKAQVTLFVIIALVIIILFIIIFFASKKKVVKDEFKTESVPEQFKPVSDYVEGCIHSVAIEAIKKVGAHGGYIDPADAYSTGRSFIFDLSNPATSELVSLTGEKEDAVPYYLHVPGKASFRNFLTASETPTIAEVEAQISRYINANLLSCIANFEPINEKGFNTASPDQAVSSMVRIFDKTVEIFVTYNVTSSYQDVSTSMSKFKTVVYFPLLKYFDYAQTITDSEFYKQYLESFSINLISYYSGVDFTKLPPFYARSNQEYIVTWNQEKVRHDLESLLASYIPSLQVKGTKGYTPIMLDGSAESIFYKYFELEIFNETETNLSRLAITFMYTGQPTYVKVQPSVGSTIRHSIEVSEGMMIIPKSRDNNYNFFYDFSFPVIVEIRGYEPESEIQEYSFLFALESNLIENKRALEWYYGMGTVDWDPSNIELNTDAIEAYTINGSTYKPRKPTLSLFCDPTTWMSGNVVVKTIDSTSGKALEGVDIIYRCGDYDECWAGSTEILPQEGLPYAKWEGKLPVCMNGYLWLSKDGYGSKSIKLSAEGGKDILLTTQKLDKIRELDVSLNVLDLQKNIYREDWEWKEDSEMLDAPRQIDASDEQVVLTVVQKEDDALNNPISNVFIFGKDAIDNKIKLVPGEYEVKATLIDYNGIKIPGNCSRICKTDVIVCLDYEYYPAQPVDVPTIPWGGIDLSEGSTGNFEVTATELDNNKQIKFNVIKLPDLTKSAPPGGCIEHLQEMSMIPDYSSKYKDSIWPVLS